MYTGRDYSHRRDWVERRIRKLAGIFSIDICAYAVMSNHLHVVLHIDERRANTWDKNDILARYAALFPSFADINPSDETIEIWRARLTDISWFMRTLNEHIARKANKEDNVTGRFWEGRFKSQPIVDTQGLLTCMAYVDLNPVRANIANDLNTSTFTSIHSRITQNDTVLAPFLDTKLNTIDQQKTPLPFSLESYLTLLIWTMSNLSGKQCSQKQPPALIRAHRLSSCGWTAAFKRKDINTATFLGHPDALTAIARHQGKTWVKGLSLARMLIT